MSAGFHHFQNNVFEILFACINASCSLCLRIQTSRIESNRKKNNEKKEEEKSSRRLRIIHYNNGNNTTNHNNIFLFNIFFVPFGCHCYQVLNASWAIIISFYYFILLVFHSFILSFVGLTWFHFDWESNGWTSFIYIWILTIVCISLSPMYISYKYLSTPLCMCYRFNVFTVAFLFHLIFRCIFGIFCQSKLTIENQ